jgi:hypothetical protein
MKQNGFNFYPRHVFRTVAKITCMLATTREEFRVVLLFLKTLGVQHYPGETLSKN